MSEPTFETSSWARMRWPLLLGLAALAARPIDEAFVGFMNPDFPHALDGLAQWCDAWSTRLLLFGLFGCLFLDAIKATMPETSSGRP